MAYVAKESCIHGKMVQGKPRGRREKIIEEGENLKNDFRFDKIFLEPFVAHNEDDEGDILFGWVEDEDDLPENFIEGIDEEEDVEYFFPEKNLTFDSKV